MESKKDTGLCRRFKVLVKIFGDSDKMILFDWLLKRDVNIEENEIPGHGYMVSSVLTREPIACGFLREHGRIGFVEGMTTNPDATSEERSEAMDDLICHLLDYAKRKNIKKVIGYTLHESIVARTERLGFKRQPHILIAIDLGE